MLFLEEHGRAPTLVLTGWRCASWVPAPSLLAKLLDALLLCAPPILAVIVAAASFKRSQSTMR
jgi:hypothetical protein